MVPPEMINGSTSGSVSSYSSIRSSLKLVELEELVLGELIPG
jgi:hypothetical protein